MTFWQIVNEIASMRQECIERGRILGKIEILDDIIKDMEKYNVDELSIIYLKNLLNEERRKGVTKDA